MGGLLQRNRRCSSSSSSDIPLSLFMVFFLAIFSERSLGVVSALEYSKDKQPSSLTLENIQKYLSNINKPAVLSIESPDGDIIDCIDKWKQPAFDNPLLKNHKIQMLPPDMPRVKGDENNSSRKNEERVEISGWGKQVWHQNGTRCPKGTVPIRRIKVDDVLRAQSPHDFGRKQPRKDPFFNVTVDDDPDTHEYAIVNLDPEFVMFGASAKINVWNPFTEEEEMSLAQIWLVAGDVIDRNTIEVGWQVYPRLYGDSGTRLFVYWTADGYESTGCYNIDCPGFVQVDQTIVVGGTLLQSSTPDPSQQYEANVKISKDSNGNWMLTYDGIQVGYWPPILFTYLRESAEIVQWGGEVVNLQLDGSHTKTHMGSGQFPQERYGKAAFFRQLRVVDANDDEVLPSDISVYASNPNCYNLDLHLSDNDEESPFFFYGGPGFSTTLCP